MPLLARLAAEVDPHVKLVTQIMIAPLYHPVMLAEEIATLDVVTEGRLVFGAGLGYRPEEFDYLDVPYKQRAGRFDESLELMKRLWTEENVTHHGKYWQLEDVHPHLFPVQQPHPPIWIGAHAIPGVQRCAKYGDAYACPPETPMHEIAVRHQIVQEGFAERGKEFGPQPLRRNCLVADSREEAIVEFARVAQGRYLTYANKGLDVMKDKDLENEFAKAVSGHAVIGTPDDVVATLTDYVHKLPGRPAAAPPAVADHGRRRDDRRDQPARQGRRAGDARPRAPHHDRRGRLRRARRGVTAAMAMQYYTDLVPAFPDPETWTFAHVLRHHAAERPDAVCLDLPEEGATWTYAEALEFSERVASGVYAAGARQGDRVVLMAVNSSQFVRTWWGTAVGGLVEVPINTNYEGEFLRHQLDVAQARFAVIDDVFAERWVAVAEHARGIEKFWVIDTGAGSQDKAVALLREHGWEAAAWEELEATDKTVLPTPRPQDLGAIFFTSGTTGPVQGRGDAALAALLLRRRSWSSLTRLTPEDAYLTTTPLFHGNAQFMAAYPALVAGGRAVVRSQVQRQPLDRPRPRLRRHGHQLRRRDDGLRLEAGPRDDDPDNLLRCVFAAPDGEHDRRAVQGALRHRGVRRGLRPHRDLRADHVAVRRRPAGGRRRARRTRSGSTSGWSTPRPTARSPVGEVGELVVRPVHPWTCSNGYYDMPEKTVEVWRNLWFHTGDALRRDEDGWYYFVDRYKDALRRRGENISSYEVEQAMLGHPAVVEAAVIGVPADQEAGEDEVLAVVVTSEPADAAEILGVVRGQDPRLRHPALPAHRRRAAEDAVGEGPQGGAARRRRHRGHLRQHRCPRAEKAR